MALIPLPIGIGRPIFGGKFDLGALVTTPGAVAAMQQAGVSARELLERHARGDWGQVHSEDVGLNDAALLAGERLLSVYPLATGEIVWVITEWDRSVTTLLVPEEY